MNIYIYIDINVISKYIAPTPLNTPPSHTNDASTYSHADVKTTTHLLHRHSLHCIRLSSHTPALWPLVYLVPSHCFPAMVYYYPASLASHY